MPKVIDNEKEHHQVLYELGLLDDDDNYQLFLQQERELREHEPDIDTWMQYTKKRT